MDKKKKAEKFVDEMIKAVKQGSICTAYNYPDVAIIYSEHDKKFIVAMPDGPSGVVVYDDEKKFREESISYTEGPFGVGESTPYEILKKGTKRYERALHEDIISMFIFQLEEEKSTSIISKTA